MTGEVVSNYYKTLRHLKIAQPFLVDIELIDQALTFYSAPGATNLIDYLLKKYSKDFTIIGKHLTGVMIFNQNELPVKTDNDLKSDLEYLKNCIIISGAVHCGLENTLHSALLKLNRAKETLR